MHRDERHAYRFCIQLQYYRLVLVPTKILLRIQTCAYSFLSRLMQPFNEFVPIYMY